VSIGNVSGVNAYKIAQNLLEKKAGEASSSGEASGTSGGGFADMVSNAAKDGLQSVKNAEKVSMDALSGQASLADVVTAVNSADMALKTVVAVRDKVIGAYQDIIKMPI